MPAVRQRQTAPIPKLGFSVSEAVLASGIGRDAIMGAIHRGELPARQVGPGGSGKKYVIARPALEAFIGFTVDPEAPAGDPDDTAPADPEPDSDAAGDPGPEADTVIDPEALDAAQPVPDGPAAPPVEQ